jgi:dUTP pyrophosphatase
MTEVMVEVVRLPHAEGLELPAYASAGAAAMDLLAAVAEPVVLPPGGRAAVPTGLMVALPAGHELQIRPRSGLALNQGLLVANAPGTVDEDYRGEIKVILMNAGREPFLVTRGMRIAQAVLAPVTRIAWREVTALGDTARGARGFGSTGI